MNDSYPEHLNPFAEDVKSKSKLSISHSFKGFKRTLRKSFRIKKKDEEEEVTIRQKTDTLRRPPVTTYPNQTIALPRSRFHERLTKCGPSRGFPGPNPFDEEEESKQVPSASTRRKGKKRAPLPPRSSSSQNVNDENFDAQTRGSHWSLTSAETDYSDSTDVTPNKPETEDTKEAILGKIIDFNKEMEKLNDDSNNNVIITKEKIEEQETETSNNVPDLVISCPSDTESTELTRNEDKTHNVNGDKVSETDNDLDDEELIVTDVTSNMINEDDKVNVEETETFLYHEKKSLYIAGSRDELNESNTYTGRVSLYITGSSDDLDACNNNEVCDKNGIDENRNDEAYPIPKQRKNKLSKNILLGM